MLAVVVLLVLLAFEVDGVDDGVGALRGFDGVDEIFLTANVDAIREDDKRLTTLLFGHELVGCEEESVVEGRPT